MVQTFAHEAVVFFLSGVLVTCQRYNWLGLSSVNGSSEHQEFSVWLPRGRLGGRREKVFAALTSKVISGVTVGSQEVTPELKGER